MATKHLKGLNTLRFLAASLVLFDHARHHLNEMDISFAQNIPVLHKGLTAVNFFFTLSGFLISYLAFNELEKKGKINYKFFYIRRAFRIMPLYYLVFIVTFVLVGVVVPLVLGEHKLGFPPVQGGALFFLMIPNLVNAIWQTSVGSLNILWSIGVEEQFYLLFPLIIFFIKSKTRRLLRISVLAFLYLLLYWLVQLNVFNLSNVMVAFLGTLKFHYMLVGICFAVVCHKYLQNKENTNNGLVWFINNKMVQIAVFLLVLITFLLPTDKSFVIDLLSSILFAFLIVIVSHRKDGGILDIKLNWLSYFGVISYGIYLLHPLVSYFLRFAVVKIHFVKTMIENYPYLYLIILLICTLVLAHISYQYFEKKFLVLKNKYKS